MARRKSGLAMILGIISQAVLLSQALQDDCPSSVQGKQVELRFRHQARNGPHPLFSGHHIPHPCPAGKAGCANPVPYYWEAFCSFKTGWEHTWTDYMICPPEKQAAAADYYTSRRHVAGFEELLDFTPCSLWPLIRGRTLWLIGDSHTYDLFHSVACLMLDFWDYAFQGSFPTDGEEQALEAMAQHVVHSKPPECLPLLEGTMVCHFRVNHGQVMMGHALPLLERIAKPSDIAVVNFGAWHGGGEDAEFAKLMREFADAVSEKAAALPHLVWKEMVPTHYDQQHGLYPGGDPPYECRPLHVALQNDGTVAATDDWSQIILEQGHHNKAAKETFAGTGIAMTSFWNATVEMWDFHRDVVDGRGHECSHYCFPGVPQVWVYHIYRAIHEAPWSPTPPLHSRKVGMQE